VSSAAMFFDGEMEQSVAEMWQRCSGRLYALAALSTELGCNEAARVLQGAAAKASLSFRKLANLETT
jgi:hypothetical protein